MSNQIFLLHSALTSVSAFSSERVLYVDLSFKCFIPHSMYCFVLTPTGPRFLSAGAMVTLGFCLMALRSDCWAVDRFETVVQLTNEVRID